MVPLDLVYSLPQHRQGALPEILKAAGAKSYGIRPALSHGQGALTSQESPALCRPADPGPQCNVCKPCQHTGCMHTGMFAFCWDQSDMKDQGPVGSCSRRRSQVFLSVTGERVLQACMRWSIHLDISCCGMCMCRQSTQSCSCTPAPG